MQRPLFHIVCAWIAGQVAGLVLDLPVSFLFAAVAVALSGQAWLLRRTPKTGEPASSQGVLIVALFLLLGWTSQRLVNDEDARWDRLLQSVEEKGWLRLEGTVSGTPETRADSLLVNLRDARAIMAGRATALPGKIRLRIGGEALPAAQKSPPMAGQALGVWTRLKAPQPPGNPDIFDYRANMRANGYLATASHTGPASIEWREPEGGPRWSDRFQRAAASLRRATSSMFAREARPERAALLRAMLFGETQLLSPEARQIFIRAGLAHIFSVSGLHATLIALTLFFLLRLFGASYRLTWMLTAILVWAFAALVGFNAPVIRAAIMTTVFAGGAVLGRQSDGLNTLSFAALLLLVCDPRALWKADFQMSYSCMVSMFTLGPAFLGVLSLRLPDLAPGRRFLAHQWNTWVAQPLAMSFACQLTLIPVLASYYHEVSIAAPLSNALALPFGSAAVAIGFLMMVFGHLTDLASLALGGIGNFLLAWFDWMALGLGRLRWASVAVRSFPWWAAAAYYTILFSGPYLLSTDRPGAPEKARSRLTLHIAALVAFLVWSPVWGAPAGELMIRTLDIGQGDAIYLKFPSGQTLLVDGGTGRPRDMGASVIVPYLKSRGVKRLSAVVATHADADHIGGLASVLASIPVGTVIAGPSQSGSASYRAFVGAAEKSGALWTNVWRGDRIGGIPNARIDVLHPAVADAARLRSNELSVVLRVQYGAVSTLLTGDAGKPAEEAMLAAGEPLDSDYLKAGHHGSRTSSTDRFLDAVTPLGVFISCGRNNVYRHPHAEFLDRLTRRGLPSWRTDLDGSVALFTDGERARIETTKAREQNP